MRALILARFTFKEAVRKKVLLGGLVLTLAFVGLYGLGVYFAFREWRADARASYVSQQQITFFTGQLELAAFWAVNFLAGLVAIALSVGAISNEVESGTLHAIVPKPLGRWEIVLGKALGYGAMLTVYVLLASSLVMAVTFAIGGYRPPRALEAISLIVLETWLLIGLCLLGSTILPTLANAIVVLMLYGLGIVGGWVELIGSYIRNNAMVNTGIISSFLMPTDSLWRLAADHLEPKVPGIPDFASPFTGPSTPSIWMVVYASLYALAALTTAVLVFQRKDL